jgi:hypothetical protein
MRKYNQMPLSLRAKLVSIMQRDRTFLSTLSIEKAAEHLSAQCGSPVSVNNLRGTNRAFAVGLTFKPGERSTGGRTRTEFGFRAENGGGLLSNAEMIAVLYHALRELNRQLGQDDLANFAGIVPPTQQIA